MHNNVLIRKIAILLAIIICFPIFAVYAETKVETNEATAVLLDSLNISLGNREFTSNTEITRAEAIALAIKFMNVEPVRVNSSSFADVSANEWGADEIETARGLGLARGYGDGTFKPNDKITYGDMIIIVARALGYDTLLKNSPNPVATASGMGFTNGISGIGYDDYVPYGVAQSMLYNALSCNVMELSYSGTGKYDKDTQALEKYFDVFRGSGVLTASEITSLSGYDTTGIDCVRINNEEFSANSENISEYLGQNIKFYYKDNDDGKTIMYVYDSLSEVVNFEIDGEYTTYNKNEYKIYNEGKQKRYELDINHDLIYNDVIVLKDRKSNLYMPENGDVKLVDKDDDGDFDVVFVKSYETVVVSRHDVESETIFDKIEKRQFEYGNIKYLHVYDADGYITDISKVINNSVLLISKSLNGDVMDIIISGKSVFGAVEKTDDYYYYINGIGYKLSNVFSKTENSVIQLNKETTFLLDANDKIVWQMSEKENAQIYYLLKAYADESDEDTVYIKVLNSVDETETFKLSKNVKVDSKRVGKTGTQVLAALQKKTDIGDTVTNRDVIAIRFNENEVVDIDYPYENGEPKEGESNNSFHKYVDYYELTGSDIGLLQWQGNINVLSWRIPIKPASTVIYSVPQNKDYADESEFSAAVLNKLMIANSTFIRADAYSLKYPEGYADVLVARPTSGVAMAKAGGRALVKDIYVGLNEDEEVKTIVEMAVQGQVKTYYVSDDFDIKSVGLERGDVIRFATNTKEEIVNCAVYYDYSKNKVERDEYAKDTATNQVHGHGATVMGGVYDIVDGYMRVFPGNVVPDRNTEFFYFPVNFGNSYLYSYRQKDFVPFDISKISTYSEVGENYTKLVFCFDLGMPQYKYFYLND